MTRSKRIAATVAVTIALLLFFSLLIRNVVRRQAREAQSATWTIVYAGETGVTRADPIVYDQYIGSKNSKKFHVPSCSYLPDQENQILFETRDEAIAAGYSPCGHCKP